MTPVSLSTDLWDPRSVLGVDPNDPNDTCVGVAKSTGRRCRWNFGSEQFDAPQMATAIGQLNSMAEMQPSKITSAALESLARNTLCRDFHKGQAYATGRQWKATIESHFRQHGEQLALAGTCRQLQSKLDNIKQLHNGVARERNAAEQEAKKTLQELDQSQSRCAELQCELDNMKELHNGVTREKDALEQEVKKTLQDLGQSQSQGAELQRELDNTKQLHNGVAREKDALEQEAKKTLQDLGQSQSQGAELQCELNNIKQLHNGVTREKDAAEQEVKETRQELDQSQSRCAELTEKIDRLDSQRKEDQAANSRGVAKLRQQLTELRTNVKSLDQQLAAGDREVAILKEAKALEEEKTKRGERDAQSLRLELRESNARFELLQAESSRETKRLGELLEAEREDKLSTLPPPPKVKKGFFTLIFSRPPQRILLRKISKMKTESTPYVQSVV